jgi:hypothetical protein
MENGTTLEKTYLLNVLEKQPLIPEIQQLILSGLQDSSTIVQKEVIGIIRRQHLTEGVSYLHRIINDKADPEIIAEAIETISDVDFTEKEILPFIEYPDRIVQQAALKNIIKKGNAESQGNAEIKLNELTISADPFDRIAASKILATLNTNSYDKALISLMYDSDEAVSRSAIEAAGKNAGPQLITSLMQLLPTKEKQIIGALKQAGQYSIRFVKDHLLTEKCNDSHVGKLIKILGRIKGKEACDALIELLHYLPGCAHEIIKALYKNQFKSDIDNEKKIEQFLHHFLTIANENIKMKRQLLSQAEKHKLLIRSLEIELDELKESVLSLLSFLYGREYTDRIRQGFAAKKKESIANAIELIEIVIPKEFSAPLIYLYEQTEVFRFISPLNDKKENKSNLQSICNDILTNKKAGFNNWTQACCLYTGIHNNLSFEVSILNKYAESNNRLLKEIATSLLIHK